MQLPVILLAGALATASALPGAAPVITPAPEVKDVYASSHHTSSAACSTECWASYAECNHTLTFVYLYGSTPPSFKYLSCAQLIHKP